MPAMAMDHTRDPAQELLEKIGDINAIPWPATYSNVLVAIYQRPEKTRTGIHLPTSTRDEDIYQGKVGLVIALGPRAFVDDGNVQFYSFSVKTGDWVVFRGSDSWQLAVNGVPCRMLSDTAIRMVVPSPDMVY